MGANTTYYVKVLKTHSAWVEVSALEETEAKALAMALPGVVATFAVEHWSIFEKRQ